MELPQLKRVRWAVRAALLLGVAASVTANILHARDNPISQSIAAWPPLALLLTVELISRVPVHRRSLAAARLVATATIASIAAWVSYWHMVGVASRYGEAPGAAHMIPLSVDGLVVVASICLVELGARITTLQAPALAAPGPRYDYARPIGPEPALPAKPEPRPVDNLSTPERPDRKAHPTAADRVIAAHNRTPKATDERLAERLNLSTKTVRRHRPPKEVTPEPETAQTERQLEPAK